MSTEEKKKIIFSSYDEIKNPYYAGGGAIAIHEVAKRLQKKFAVTVITGKYPGAKDENIDGVFYKHIGFSFHPKISQLLFHFFLPFYVMTEAYDIWLESFTPPISTSFLQLFTKKPVVGLTHMLSGEEMWQKYKIPFFLIEKLGLRTYKYFIVLSDYYAQWIRTLNRGAIIAVIPNGTCLSQIEQSERKKENYILFLGRIEVTLKGLSLLLAAYKLICQKIPYKLYIAGSGLENEEIKLKILIAKLGLQDSVVLLGKVVGKEKAELFSNAAFLVFPSRAPEGFGMVLLEAFSFGLPVILYDIESLSWVPKKFTWKVKPFSIKDLSDAILALSHDERKRELMGKEAVIFAEQYSWENIYTKYETLIDKFLDAKPVVAVACTARERREEVGTAYLCGKGIAVLVFVVIVVTLVVRRVEDVHGEKCLSNERKRQVWTSPRSVCLAASSMLRSRGLSATGHLCQTTCCRRRL